MKPALLTLIIPFVFYLILPLLGDLVTSYKWSVFRKRILIAVTGSLGMFFGHREGYSRKKGLWFRSSKGMALLDLNQPILVYQYISGREKVKPFGKADLPDFPEGSDFLVIGDSSPDKGYEFFQGTKKIPVILIATDTGKEETLKGVFIHGFRSALFFNVWTPWSILAGFLFSLFLVNRVMVNPEYRYLLKLVLWESLIPLFLILPPGGVLTFLSHIISGIRNQIRSKRSLGKISALLEKIKSEEVVFGRFDFQEGKYFTMGIAIVLTCIAGLVINTALFLFYFVNFLPL